MAFPFLAFYQLPYIFISRTKDINGTSDLLWTIGGASLSLTLVMILVIISIKLFMDYESRFKSVV
ncbi:hypothetical protein ITJ86_03715 [Winogradskyella sp. F6397]|uniref:Uncharacterized protein n=1 Tax=Winogradskyella marina TaxID=2785530 RepID=A0ABS0EEV1_9FLAO|nr:hypothetical protein [Winogradskyella marina]MBF8148988.1 hypothetical protein [Winogradskyella marina]